MSDLPTWDTLRDGTDCPFDPPRPDTSPYHFFVRSLAVSSLYLTKDQTYRGRCVLIYDGGHVTRLSALARAEWLALAGDLHAAETALYHALQPDHVNVESLGNVIPHLHWHIIPRYRDDGRWGGPIWTTTTEEMPRRHLDASAYPRSADEIRQALDSVMKP